MLDQTSSSRRVCTWKNSAQERARGKRVALMQGKQRKTAGVLASLIESEGLSNCPISPERAASMDYGTAELTSKFVVWQLYGVGSLSRDDAIRQFWLVWLADANVPTVPFSTVEQGSSALLASRRRVNSQSQCERWKPQLPRRARRASQSEKSPSAWRRIRRRGCLSGAGQQEGARSGQRRRSTCLLGQRRAQHRPAAAAGDWAAGRRTGLAGASCTPGNPTQSGSAWRPPTAGNESCFFLEL